MSEFGYVVGRFVRSAKPGEGELQPQRGDVYVQPGQVVPVLGEGSPATAMRTPERLFVDDQGRICTKQPDGALTPGVWLTAGRHVITTRFWADTPPWSFEIEVTPEHTEDSPLDLTLAAPVDLPPQAVEVVRVEDRERAEAAATEAATYAQTASEAAASAQSSAGAAEGHMSDAAGSATAASASATEAAASEQAAQGHVSAAEASASAAATSASTAESHAQSASTSASEALGYRDQASGFATAAEDSLAAMQALGLTVDTSVGTKVSTGGHVIFYDSGWRDITSGIPSWGLIYQGEDLLPGEGVWVRRLLTETQLRIRGRTRVADNSNAVVTGQLPAGYVPTTEDNILPLAVVIAPGMTANTRISTQSSGPGRVYAYRNIPVDTLVDLRFTFPIGDPLPRSLPGTPA